MRWVGVNSILDEMDDFKYAESNIFEGLPVMLRLFSVWLLLIVLCLCAQFFDFYVYGKNQGLVNELTVDE